MLCVFVPTYVSQVLGNVSFFASSVLTVFIVYYLLLVVIRAFSQGCLRYHYLTHFGIFSSFYSAL